MQKIFFETQTFLRPKLTTLASVPSASAKKTPLGLGQLQKFIPRPRPRSKKHSSASASVKILPSVDHCLHFTVIQHVNAYYDRFDKNVRHANILHRLPK